MDDPTSPVPEDDPSTGPIPDPEVPKFKEADAEDLTVDVHMEADETVGTLVAKGKAFRPNRAEAIPLADLIRSFALTLYKIALGKSKLGDVVAPADLDEFQFASAHIRFVTGEHETMRMDEGGSPTLEAAQQIAFLMQAQGDDLLSLAQETGPEGAKAYKGFMRAVSQAEDAEVCWKASGSTESVSITSINASKAFLILDREGEAEDEVLKAIPGHLSMADAGAHRFKLLLPKAGDFERPTPLKNKRVLEGSYDDPIGESVKSQGLWDRDVIATIRIERERAETVAAPRDPTFKLIAVEAAVEIAPPAEGHGNPAVEPPTLLDGDDEVAGG